MTIGEVDACEDGNEKPALAYLGLRHLLRLSSAVEVRTNDLLLHLITTVPGLRSSFLAHLSSLTGVDVRRCVIQRENAHIDESGRRSFRDFSLHDPGGLRCVIETKVDSPLTSSDQAARYLAQVDVDGALLLVTRRVLLDGLTDEVQRQLGCPLSRTDGVYRGHVAGRQVVVTSWTRLLATSARDDAHPELLALAAALEDDITFPPFDATVDDAAVARTMHHIVYVAREVCASLERRLIEVGVTGVKVGKSKSDIKWHYVDIEIADHWLWLGYDAEYWAAEPSSVPGGGANLVDLAPSPLWIARFDHRPRRGHETTSAANRERLDRLGATIPLRVPQGCPTEVVIADCLDQACTHLRRLAAALMDDPSETKTPSLKEGPTPQSGFTAVEDVTVLGGDH